MTCQLLAVTITVFAAVSAPAGAQTDASDLVKQGQKLEFDGQLTEALALYRKVLEQNPERFDAHMGIGRVLDMEGQYAEAREHLRRAIEFAPEASRNQALATMAVSYAFEGDAAGSAKYYQTLFDRQLKAGSPEGAASIANAVGRVHLETGDLANAEKWYRTGYETAKKIERLVPESADLWEMRWRHAQGRIAARRQQFDAARQHVDEVRTIVARGNLDEGQRANAPHLAGYVAFYQEDYNAAIEELLRADQTDPFILSLPPMCWDRDDGSSSI